MPQADQTIKNLSKLISENWDEQRAVGVLSAWLCPDDTCKLAVFQRHRSGQKLTFSLAVLHILRFVCFCDLASLG